jgi:F-type H+-transporting ATPase subunit b
MALFQDSNFWVLLSFLLFIAIFLRYGKSAALGILDKKIETIRTELTQAETLRVEAQELLAEYQRKHKDAMKEAEKIIAEAKNNAQNIRAKAKEDAKKAEERREKQLQEKLTRIEQNARSEIETYIAKIAVQSAAHVLSNKIDAKTDKVIISNTLDNIPKTLN